MNTIKKIPNSVLLLAACYVPVLVWWVNLTLRGVSETGENYIFGIILGLLTIICGVTGLTKSKDWGYFSSNIGRFIIFLSSGFIAWGIGTLIIGYFNIALDQVYPYPSIADLAYILSWPLWFIGMLNLYRATGAHSKFKETKGKLIALLIIIFALSASYYFLFILARGGMISIANENLIRIFFDFAYPVGDAVIITTSLLLFGLSIKYLGGFFRTPILLIIFGFILNYVADIIFTYINTIGTYSVGNWVDMLYATVFFILGIAVNLFDRKMFND